MPNTIGGGAPWEYLPVLNECIRILLTTAIGALVGRVGTLNANAFVPQAVKFVFNVALPLHIFRGIGIVVDFYDDSFLWAYIGAFLILRAIALLVSIAMVLIGVGQGRQGIGQVAVNWLSLTWISTVILGVPISQAVFGSEDKGLFYGLLAGISSFIFQLPFQLLFLECHVLETEYLESKRRSTHTVDVAEENMEEGQGSQTILPEPEPEPMEAESDESVRPESEPKIVECSTGVCQEHSSIKTIEDDSNETYSVSQEAEDENLLLLWLQFARRGDIWKKVLLRVVRNPVLWGIAGGFVLSLSTIGPTYLNPKSPDFVPGLAWIFQICAWLGACVSPVSLIAMGVWLQKQGKGLFMLPLPTASLYMFSKLFIVPLIMVGLALALNLNDEAGRAAVLIAALPISMASFTLAGYYNIGETVLSANVALGTALMLPTLLLWNLAMDAVGLFPIAEDTSSSA